MVVTQYRNERAVEASAQPVKNIASMDSPTIAAVVWPRQPRRTEHQEQWLGAA